MCSDQPNPVHNQMSYNLCDVIISILSANNNMSVDKTDKHVLPCSTLGAEHKLKSQASKASLLLVIHH